MRLSLKLWIKREMGESGTAFSKSAFSRTQPCVSWSRATLTHTESTVSAGTYRTSATTMTSCGRSVTESCSRRTPSLPGYEVAMVSGSPASEKSKLRQ